MFVQVHKDQLLLGVISDTHGLVHSEIKKLFSNVDYLIHAGDIGSRDVLADLEKIAPVCAVLGNVDNAILYPSLSENAIFETPSNRFYILHNLQHLDFDPLAANVSCIISGHTHIPHIHTKDKVLYLNPGSIGPKRFSLPVSAALLKVDGNRLEPTLLTVQH
jgi:putative phosphoesterase